MEANNHNHDEADLSFSDALLKLEILDQPSLAAALEVVPEAERNEDDLPGALIGAGVITREQARDAFYLILAHHYASDFEGYEIKETLGQGAVGTVFRAHQARLERDVAIKVLDESMTSIPSVREAFLSEARVALRLSHPNMVQGFELIEREDLCAYVMELVEGRTVETLIQARGPMEERQALNIVRDVARALEHAEEMGVIHRDIKPANVLVGRNRVAKLLDVGLAKVVVGPGASDAENGMAVGTPNYMSPEQIRGDRDIGNRADIYSLGATLYFMITGQTPFTGKPEVVMYKHIHEPVASPKNLRPECSDAMVNLIFSMMAKNPEDRPSTATALIVAIDDALANAGKSSVVPAPPMIAPTPPLAAPEITLPSRRKKKGRGKRFVDPRTVNQAAESTTPQPAPIQPTPAQVQPAPAPIQPAPKPIAMPEALGGKRSAQPSQPAPVALPVKKASPKPRRRRNMR